METKDCGHNAKRDRESSYCHSCYMRDWREKNRDKVNRYQRNRRAERIASEPGYRDRLAKQLRDYNRKKKYGLSRKDYERLLAKAESRCEICGSDGSNSHHGRLCIDHCHKSGSIRGLLCDACNKKLGAVGDTLEAIMPFVSYLKRHEGMK